MQTGNRATQAMSQAFLPFLRGALDPGSSDISGCLLSLQMWRRWEARRILKGAWEPPGLSLIPDHTGGHTHMAVPTGQARYRQAWEVFPRASRPVQLSEGGTLEVSTLLLWPTGL